MNKVSIPEQSALITPKSENFNPATWPPKAAFPVVINGNGKVLSRYGDIRWDLSPWAGHTLTIYFGDGPEQCGIIGAVSVDGMVSPAYISLQGQII